MYHFDRVQTGVLVLHYGDIFLHKCWSLLDYFLQFNVLFIVCVYNLCVL